MQGNHEGGEHVKRLARRTKLYVGLAVAVLAALALLLALRVGQPMWPGWLVAFRGQAIGFVLLGLLVTIFFAPVIVEANSHPRHLSGPGKNPESPYS